MDASAIILFSGGQDSAVCLAWALENFDHVETVGFDYGQTHAVEMEVRQSYLAAYKAEFPKQARRLGDDHVIDLRMLAEISDTALTQSREIKMLEAGLPNTFVPGRNLMFLTVAAALGYRRDASNIVGGMCETDYSGYPDCRDDTIKAMQVALCLGMEKQFILHTPLMWMDKAASWAFAENLGGKGLVELIRVGTHTCYRGDRSKLHAWGYGCGKCPACELREAGWAGYSVDLAGGNEKENKVT